MQLGDAFVIRGLSDLLVLAALCESPCHGYGIAARLDEIDELPDVTKAAIYATLQRLRKAGYVAVVETRTVEQPRRVFEITNQGQVYLDDGLVNLETFITTAKRLAGKE